MSAPQPPGVPDQSSTEAPTGETPRPQSAPAHDEPSTWQPGLYLKIGLLLVAIAWAIAFVAENTKRVNVHFVFGTANVHLIWMILLLLAVGIVGGVLFSQLYRHRRRTKLAQKAGK